VRVEEKWEARWWESGVGAVEGSSGGDMRERIVWRDMLPRRARPGGY
jgi:hypothetical protein